MCAEMVLFVCDNTAVVGVGPTKPDTEEYFILFYFMCSEVGV
jgi:hypothetical protein